MNDWLRRRLSLAMMVAAVGMSASACADNESSVFIRGVLKPDDTKCSFVADPSTERLPVGSMDLAFTREYYAGLLVGNELVEKGSSDLLRTETSRFRIEGAEVELETSDGNFIRSFTMPVAGFADPAESSDPGWGVAYALLIDANAGNQMMNWFVEGERNLAIRRIVSVVKVFGKTLGGQEVESAEFRYPINVCYGCLVDFPLEANDSESPLGQPNCENLGRDLGSGIEVPCRIGQDDLLDCRVCKSRGFGRICDPF